MRRLVSISTLAILLAVILAAPTLASATTEENSISPELLTTLKEPMAARVQELRKEKNDVGASYIYGSYYNNFAPWATGTRPRSSNESRTPINSWPNVTP